MSDESPLDSLRREVAATTWWHTIDLGNGVVTPGIDPTPARRRIHGYQDGLALVRP